jgi:prefoldin alpha subunit
LQSTKDATKFYDAKVEDLGNNLKDLEAIIGQKSNNLRVVEDGKSQILERGRGNMLILVSTVLRQKVLSSGAGPSAQ